ncbi:hypothetical protein [Nesterenkonia sp. PF2B19]|nr:hypothetical protein [Nesterenkonia sp. PF2B19]
MWNGRGVTELLWDPAATTSGDGAADETVRGVPECAPEKTSRIRA